MSYQKEREFFLLNFDREFPKAPQNVAERLLRCATSSQRYGEITCSIDVGEHELTRLEKREESNVQQARVLATNIGSSLLLGEDVRGFPMLLGCPSGRTYDFGQRGLGIPGRGLPVSAFGG